MNNKKTSGLSADWFIRVLKGAAVGIGGILPGLSGGVLAVIFGLYDQIINFLANPFKAFWKNIRYFLPVGIGFAIGILIFSIFVEKAFGQYAAIFITLFIGFVIGTLPSLFKTAGEHGRNTSDWLVLTITAIVIFCIMFFGDQVVTQVQPSVIAWFFSGALIGLGVIVPGMSPSNFLIYFGLYDKMAAGIAALDFSVIIPLGLGGLLCVLGLAKGAEWAFNHYYAKMYHFILGTVIGSSIALFPTQVFPSFSTEGLATSGLSFTTTLIWCLVALVIGTIFSYQFSKFEETVERD
jgi:putative membrane protein